MKTPDLARIRASVTGAQIDALDWAAANPAALAQMGRNARARCEARHTPARNFDQLMQVYREAIAGHG